MATGANDAWTSPVPGTMTVASRSVRHAQLLPLRRYNGWWSNPTHYSFVNGTTATVTLTVPVATGNWSDWNGQSDLSVGAAFAQAVTYVGQIGLSFGGGCFFANGVGVSPGTATFSLTSYSL